jgi:hypothetical protein
MKNKVMVGLIMLVKDNLVDMVVKFTNLALAWQASKLQFQSRNASQINFLLQQLRNINMKEGIDIQEYISKTRDLNNYLAMLGKPISERTFVNLLLNKFHHN